MVRWSRTAQPVPSSWAAVDRPRRPVEPAVARGSWTAGAGLLRLPVRSPAAGGTTAPPARWGAKLEAGGTQALLPVGDNASRHVSRTVRSRVRAHHQRDHRPIAPLGQRHCAGPVGRHDRLEAAASVHLHEAPGLPRDHVCDGPRSANLAMGPLVTVR
jgi:hypothetical protein